MMRIRFFGVRGSLPAPALPSQIKNKISAIIGMMTPEDLKSAETRERFITDLPPWLSGTVGGNSSCVAVQFDETMEAPSRDILIFDAGSGIRELGLSLEREGSENPDMHIFFSHFHWDHIMGLPFLNYAYDRGAKLNFYSPLNGLEGILRTQMLNPYFPVKLEAMVSEKSFRTLTGPMKLPSCQVTYKKMNHPGDSYAYKVDDGKRRFIYSTDTELTTDDFLGNDENTGFFQAADLLVIDSQYTPGEAVEKYNWGHSAFNKAVDFAAHWDIGHLVLFHHDPAYDDSKLYENLQSAKLYAERVNAKKLKISLAAEEMEIIL